MENKTKEKLYDFKRKKITTRNIKKVLPLYTKHKKLLTFTLICIFCIGVFGIFEPIFSARAWAFLAEGEFHLAMTNMLIMFAISFVSILFRGFNDYLYVKITLRIKMDLTDKVIRSIGQTQMKKLDNESLGAIADKLSSDVSKVSQVYLDILGMIFNFITNVVFLVYIVFLNIYMFLIILVYIALLYIICTIRARNWIRGQRATKKAYDRARTSYFEQISGIRDVKLLNIGESFTNFSNHRFEEALDIQEKVNLNRNFIRRIEATLGALFELAFMFFGILFVGKSVLTLAGLLIIYLYHGKIDGLVNYIATMKEMTAEGEISATRIFEIIENYPKETFGTTELENFSGKIELKDVHFGYNPEVKVLDGLNITFNPNEVTAIVGKSGAGKTTILSLISKLYDIQSGEILFDGVSINDLTENSIRGNVSEVSQIPYIFNASIRENLLFAKPDATEEELIDVLQKARIYDDILEMPEKLETQIGENGMKLSGGQRQRIAIARLLLKKSKVIVFDEATSALDNNRQTEIVEMLRSMKADKTIIVVAHRLSTIVDSDKIYMLQNGKVLANGKHKWLMHHCKEYKELYKLEEEKAKDEIE